MDALVEKSCKVFRASGDRFFSTFKKMHDALLKASSDGPFRLREGNLGHTTRVDQEEIMLVLRFWSGELVRPKKRRNRQTLYDRVQDLLSDPLVHNAIRAVCLELAWDWVQTECGTRLANAEESTHWDQDSNEERAAMWGSRHDAMSALADGMLSRIAEDALDGNLNKFAEALKEGFEELDCA
tara:strand:- start:281 stop:829 length:549 start_codon:yes stop_codon:yes gene_type:complete